MQKITIVGMGYVGLSNAVLLSQKNEVCILEKLEHKISMLNKNKTPINDELIQKYLSTKKLKLSSTSKKNRAYENSSIIVICIPTNFDKNKNEFNTDGIKEILYDLNKRKFSGLIVIRSTIPIGFTKKMQETYKDLKLAFFPEFLREGSALNDCLKPSRIILGSQHEEADIFLRLLQENATRKNIPTIKTQSCEAEAIKLFSNAYLAMRIAYFNELDSFAMTQNLNSNDIINGICMDERIGNFYNNPSFGFGGYCLPKDTMQAEQNSSSDYQSLLSATISSNKKRKKAIYDEIIKKNVCSVGIFKLEMKLGSDNFRESSVISILEMLKKEKVQVFIYEPLLKEHYFMGFEVISDLDEFLKLSKLIISNRLYPDLKERQKDVFSRDLFFQN